MDADIKVKIGYVVVCGLALLVGYSCHSPSYDSITSEDLPESSTGIQYEERGYETQDKWDVLGDPSESVPTPAGYSPASHGYIKGNISASGERIYHMPGDMYYEETVIDTSKGERWFSSPEEAESAGWRRSYV